jgi:UDP-2-acetamido-3-amino-2,3-dideoxy-glucuronate N-acetyltransferase
MSPEQTPSISVIGAGYWGRNHVRNFHELSALRSVCDANPDTLKEVTQGLSDVTTTTDPDDVFADPDVAGVVIATPTETHADVVERALEAGKDVFVEKPLCLSVARGQQLVDLAAQTDRILMVGHILWYHPAVLKLKEFVDSGELGRVQYIYSNRLNFGKIRHEENILWSFAPHDISVILGLLGEMPESVRSQGGYYLDDKIADSTVSLLSFANGVRAHIFVSWLHPHKEQRLVIVGDKQMISFNDVADSDKLLRYPHAVEWQNRMPVANKADAIPIPFEMEEPLNAECRHFLDCIRTRTKPRTDGEEGLRVLRVLDQSEQSLRAERERGIAADLATNYTTHATAVIDDGAEIGADTTIWHFTHVLRGSTLGTHCKIGQNCVIGPDVAIGKGVKIQNNVSVYKGVTLEDHVFCGPSMVFTNVYNPRSEIPRMDEVRPTLVRRGATLGANCTIICGITIGRFAMIGAGAVVRDDVPDYGFMVGVPAKQIGWVSRHGHRLVPDADGTMTCVESGWRYEESPSGELRCLDKNEDAPLDA